MRNWCFEVGLQADLVQGEREKMASITETSKQVLDRILSIEIILTERAAISASRLLGHGDEKAADHAAVDAMRGELGKLLDRRHGGHRGGRA